MKKLGSLILAVMLVVGFTAGVEANELDLGPEADKLEAFATLEHTPRVGGGGRLWMDDLGIGQYAVGGEVAFESSGSTSNVELHGVFTYDYTEFLASYFDPAGIFTDHGLNVRSSFASGYKFGDNTGFSWVYSNEFAYPVTEEIDVALRYGRGIGVQASTEF